MYFIHSITGETFPPGTPRRVNLPVESESLLGKGLRIQLRETKRLFGGGGVRLDSIKWRHQERRELWHRYEALFI